MRGGRIERGERERDEPERSESHLEKVGPQESGETELESPERFVESTVKGLEKREVREAAEGKEVSEVEDWVQQAVKEVVEGEEAAERTQRWVREVTTEVIEAEKGEVPESKEQDSPSHRPWEVRSEEELEKAVERHYDLQARKDYDGRYHDAVEYCRSDAKDVEVPDLVKELEDRELRRLYEAVHGGPPEVKIERMDDLKELLEKHPAESERADFDERREFSDLYFQIREDHSMKRDEIAKAYDVSKGFVTNAWNDIETAQIKQLRAYEEERLIKEWQESNPNVDESILREYNESGLIERASERHKIHEIDSEVVRDAFEPLKDVKEPTIDDIVSAIERTIKNDSQLDKRFTYTELEPTLDTQMIKQLERSLHTNKEAIEESLSKKLELENVRARVAIIEGKMYTWIPKHRPDELVRAYEDQFYYFKDRREVIRVIDELRKNLGNEGNLRKELPYMTKVVKQLIGYDGGDSARKKPLDIHSTRIEGKVLRMYLDATGRKLSELEGSVVKVAGISGRAGIENPRFPEGRDLEVLKARLVATTASDCHLWPTGRIAYNEASISRIERVQDSVSAFGDIELEPKFRKGKYDVHVPCQIGLMLIDEGMTPGNKTINNPGLPSRYMEWSDEAKLAYLEDLIPEDGSFSKGRFTWSRSHAIYVDKEKENYSFESEIGAAEVEFVKENGKKLRGLIPKSILTIKQLEDLQYNKNPEVADIAKKVFNVVEESTNHLIHDERNLAESLGFFISVGPKSVAYYPRSGRVSVNWIAATSSKEDAIRWALDCSPNDVRKKQAVERWLKKQAEMWMDKKPLKDW